MMERMREGASSIWVKIILGLIIFSFIFAGVGGYLAGSGEPVAAKIDDRNISQREFEQAYQNERNRMQSQLGDYFNTLMGDPAYVQQFRRSVLDRLVNDVLIEERANTLGMRISDEQVRKAIVTMPEFQREGQFDNELYNSLLRRAGYTPDRFAETIRTDMLRQQLLGALQSSDFALDYELTALTKLEQQQRVVRSLTLDLADFEKRVEITDEEVKAYYEQNPMQFTRPAQVKVAYIELSGQRLKETLNVSEAEAKTYYDEHRNKYATAEQRKASHILIQGDSEEAKAKAEALLAQLKQGDDFAELAKTASDDTFSGQDGGQLDWFERGVMDPAFENAAFALSPGEISELVQSSFGFHIIKLDDVKTSEVKPFAEVREEILADLREQGAAEAFYDLQTQLAETAFEMPDSLDDAAKAVDAEVRHTDFFAHDEAPGILANPLVLQALDSPEVREDGLNSEVIEVGPEHVVVVRVDDAREETLLPFEEVAETARQQLATQKGEQAAQDKADTVIAALREGNTGILAQEDLSFSDAQTIERTGANPMLSRVAFGLAKPEADQPVYGMTRDAQGNVMIIALDAVVEANVAPIATDSQLAGQVEQMNAQRDIMATLEVLRDTADVSYPTLDAVEN
ncbi:peptidylprolyl isomerase [Photobacterium sp. TY1-4]|uniref:peptidylprolyl isomerase n=1 Tax=Photobacterium sp. TY1-4 TaxID=2899122 RepID=UPI0021BF3334|nr:peptidylprolyl isomerase [Photobacterium sp. TY1-4]UXI00481.1 peptidylprolyl isomerase [Photobacterium sp. TY1-4]